MKKWFLVLFVLMICSTALALPIYRLAPLTISILSSTTTVTTTAGKIPATALAGRESIAIRLNDISDTVYIGHSGVTTANGFKLDSSLPAITLDLDDSVDVYAIVGSGTADVRTLEAK